MTYIKENIITKLQKLYSLHRNLGQAINCLRYFWKNLFAWRFVLPACKIFIERPGKWKHYMQGQMVESNVMVEPLTKKNPLIKQIKAPISLRHPTSQKFAHPPTKFLSPSPLPPLNNNFHAIIQKITHMWRRWGTPQNFFLKFIDELEKQIII